MDRVWILRQRGAGIPRAVRGGAGHDAAGSSFPPWERPREGAAAGPPLRQDALGVLRTIEAGPVHTCLLGQLLDLVAGQWAAGQDLPQQSPDLGVAGLAAGAGPGRPPRPFASALFPA